MIKDWKPFWVIAACIVLALVKVIFDLTQAPEPGVGFMKGNYSNDLLTTFWPHYDFMRRSTLAGEFPFWGPYFAFGTPYNAEISAALLFPATWILFLFPTELALLLIQLVNVATGIIAMYFLLRYLQVHLYVNAAASFVFGLMVFSGSFWPVIGSAYSVVPLVLMYSMKVVEQPTLKNAAGLSVSLAFCFFAGHPNVFLYTGLMIFCYCLFSVIYTFINLNKTFALNQSAFLLVALFLMLGLVAVQFLPSYELTNLSSRVGPESNAIDKSIFSKFSTALLFKSFLTPENSFLWSNPILAVESGHYYLGAFILALPFCWLNKDFKLRILSLTFSLCFFILLNSANEYKFLQFLFDLPFLHTLRWHTRSIDHIQFILLVMGSVGLSSLISQKEINKKLSITLLTVSGLLLILALAFIQSLWIIISALFIAALYFSRYKQLALQPSILAIFSLLICLDIASHRQYPYPIPYFNKSYSSEYEETIKQYKAQGSYERVLIYPHEHTNPTTVANFGNKYSISTIANYSSFAHLRWENFLRSMISDNKFVAMTKSSLLHAFQGTITPPVLNRLVNNKHYSAMLSIRYVIDEDKKLSELDYYLPRAYLVTQYIKSSNEQQSLKLIKNNISKLKNNVIVENYTPSFSSQDIQHNSNAEIQRFTNNQVVIDTESDYPTILVLTDNFYNGWQVTVDGKPATIFRANSMFRGVELPAGKHTVKFKFIHTTLVQGAWISFATLLLLILLLKLTPKFISSDNK